jgi:hypothetical protein
MQLLGCILRYKSLYIVIASDPALAGERGNLIL